MSINTFSQQDNLIEKASELVYSNPDETIKIADLILKTSQDFQEKSLARLILSKCYLVKGEYNKALSYAFDDNNQLEEVDIVVRAENNIIKSTLLRKIYLDKQSKDYLSMAQDQAALVPDNVKESLQNQIAIERIKMSLDRRNTVEALTAINDAEEQFKSLYSNSIKAKKSLYGVKEKAFIDIAKYDSAYAYIDKIFLLDDLSRETNLYEKASLYRDLGHIFLQKKEFKKSEENLFIALRFSEIIGNANLLMLINRELAINYLASNQKNQHKVYNDEFLLLNNEVELLEQESVNMAYNLISKQYENKTLSSKNVFTKYQNLLLAGLLFAIIVCGFILLRSQARKKRLNEIIKYLEISRNNFISIKPSKKVSKKRIIIPEDTENSIIQKLKKFESSTKYLSKDMSLAVLAGQFETNTKYLSEIINKHYNDNFNTFINKLRINYIINKLKSDSNYINYKISFLAEESGYSSHSSFATVFKSIVGMSPATFINLIREEREEEKSKESV